MNKKTSAPAPEPDLSLLLEGIRADAEAKIKAVESQAAASASAKRKKAADKAAAIEAEAAQTASARESSIKAVFEARLKTETRKLELESEERFMRRVLDLAAAEYLKTREAPEYGDRIFAWACEAAIGIGCSEAEIRVSEAEAGYLNAEFLARVERSVFELSGRSVHLSLSKEPFLDHQGLLLESEGGRLRYDNSAPARLARAEEAMRGLIRAAIESAGSGSRGQGAEQS
ncbi:MAG: V-type ATP synthase subunit E family protein [Spirochaetia bacterium]|jgi:vacuolar-type H+-ATPase subunit E/Vma4|nr:V-type ATP synthase subunit E family protein [Spirochaetia bacterium]